MQLFLRSVSSLRQILSFFEAPSINHVSCFLYFMMLWHVGALWTQGGTALARLSKFLEIANNLAMRTPLICKPTNPSPNLILHPFIRLRRPWHILPAPVTPGSDIRQRGTTLLSQAHQTYSNDVVLHGLVVYPVSLFFPPDNHSKGTCTWFPLKPSALLVLSLRLYGMTGHYVPFSISGNVSNKLFYQWHHLLICWLHYTWIKKKF